MNRHFRAMILIVPTFSAFDADDFRYPELRPAPRPASRTVIVTLLAVATLGSGVLAVDLLSSLRSTDASSRVALGSSAPHERDSRRAAPAASAPGIDGRARSNRR